jgi:hypothetical protein
MLVTGDVPAAPVDADQVRRALAPFGSSRMLPRGSYLEPAVLAWNASTSSVVGSASAGPATSRRAG